MIGSGSFCTVEGVKASAFGYPPCETARAVAGSRGGGKKDRESR